MEIWLENGNCFVTLTFFNLMFLSSVCHCTLGGWSEWVVLICCILKQL